LTVFIRELFRGARGCLSLQVTANQPLILSVRKDGHVHCNLPATFRALEPPQMRNVVIAIGIMLCFCSSSRAQEVPRVEIFGGYSYLNIDLSSLSNALNQAGVSGVGDRLSLNGWEAAANVNFNRWIGVEGDLSGHYKGDCERLSGLTCKDLSFMGGPRFTYRKGKITVFAHGLFGGDTASVSTNGSNLVPGASDVSLSLSNTSFALAAGGGVDYMVTNRISFRLGQADYFLTRHFNDVGVPSQSNYRVSAGVVFTIGGMSETTSRVANHRTPASPGCEGSSEAALLGVMGCGDDTGVIVTSVLPGSPASQAGITPGDRITDIDGRPVRSNRDIEAAIAANTTGTVKIKYMIRGSWLTEREARIR
jgi:opacity protein-like surface antigen